LLLEELHAEWSPVLQNLPNDGALIHGDFNHRNIVLKNLKGTWEVACILDWELASAGSFLWDAARSCAVKSQTRSGGKTLSSLVFAQTAQVSPIIGSTFAAR
jgi:Ser/Thr protein kinase RdoA (MazF antagonist)